MKERGITIGYFEAGKVAVLKQDNQNQWEGGKWQARARHAKVLPGGLIPMCCWPSITKPPMGWPSGL